MHKTGSVIKFQLTLGYKVLRLIFKSSPKWAALAVFISLLTSVLPAVNVYIGKLVIDNVVLAAQTKDVNLYFPILFTVVGASLAVSLTNSLLSNTQRHTDNVLRDRFGKHALESVASKAASLDYSYFENPAFFDQLEKVQREIYGRPFQVLGEFLSMISSIFSIISYFVLISQLSWWAPILIFLGSIPRLFIRLSYSFRTYAITDRRSPQNRKISYLVDILIRKVSAAEVRVFQMKDYLLERFGAIYDRFLVENQKLSQSNLGKTFLSDATATLFTFVVRIYAIILTVLGRKTIGDLNMFISATSNLNTNFHNFFRSLANYYECNLFLQHYFNFISLNPTIVDNPKAKEINFYKPLRIEFKNVSFGYIPGKLILKNVSFVIPETKNLALVGENGAGKTTLVKLLLRLYEPTMGEILINGENIKNLSLTSLRKTFSVTFQNFLTYDMSVRENFGLGDVDKINSNKALAQAAKLSGANEFIDEFKDKYDTMLGRYFEKGEELSGGQWQKIALARAFFKNAPVLILDEPTASLDPRAEYEVFRNLIKATKNKSLVLISHRFSTVRLADEIVVLHKGEIVEQGSHEELMEQNGRYARLYNLQAKWYK